MTVVNWNVNWATPRSRKGREILHRIYRHAPDIVCLTEADYTLFDDMPGSRIYSAPDGIKAKETTRLRKVVLWSKTSWEQVDDQGTEAMPPGRIVSGVTRTPLLEEVTVIGVCIPYIFSRTEHTDDGITRENWEDHRNYLESLRTVLRRAPTKRLIVIGDYNQDMGGGGNTPSYLRDALRAALPTDVRIVTSDLRCKDRLLIDHIALSADLLAADLLVISKLHNGTELSDGRHCGVVGDLTTR